MSALSSSALNAALTLNAIPLTKVYATSGEPMIVNGQPADPQEYPASYRSESNGKSCTWFLVGPNVLLGAAHCVAGETETTPIANVKFETSIGEHTSICSISDGYWKDKSQDWALCRVTPQTPRPVSTIGTAGYEVVNQRSEVLTALPKLEISGFGCLAQGGPVLSNYQIGSARVVTPPPKARVFGSPNVTPNAVKIRQSPSILCAGDSGGPAFFYQKPGRVLRVVVGTNSSTAIEAGVSYLSSLSTPTAISFLKAWSRDHSVKICGVDKDAIGCRRYLP